MKLTTLFLVAFTIWSASPASAQLKMESSGHVSVGVPPPAGGSSKFYVKFDGSGTGNRYAIHGLATIGSSRHGVLGTATQGTYNYGVRGSASYGTYNYGVYGESTYGSSANWAGFFAGAVYATGGYQPSDEHLKESIRSMGGSNVFESLLLLEPRTYRYKGEEVHRRMGLPAGEHFGLIAQEVERVLPALVIDVLHPPIYDEEGNEIAEAFSLKAVNYLEMIPLLIQAIKEANARIEALEAALAGD